MLVHAGAGGVGIAAIHMAHALGCRVYATAGSADKRDFVRGLGVTAAAGSRGTDFTDLLGCSAPAGEDAVAFVCRLATEPRQKECPYITSCAACSCTKGILLNDHVKTSSIL